MNIYDIKVLDRKKQEVSMSEYKGKVLLIVNTATGCGFTPHYEWLEELYKKYKDKGFEILDFPCDQFGHQAPGTDEEINTFCTATYNTTFRRFKKIEVNGENESELFKFLKEKAPYVGVKGIKNKAVMKSVEKISGAKGNDIRWNFTKFLVDKNGEVVSRFEPTDSSELIEEEISKLL